MTTSPNSSAGSFQTTTNFPTWSISSMTSLPSIPHQPHQQEASPSSSPFFIASESPLLPKKPKAPSLPLSSLASRSTQSHSKHHFPQTSSTASFSSSPTTLTSLSTKQQLLSLLGHFNYAIRIIPQGRSFISHLLLLASSVPSLHHQVTFTPECLSELRLWHQLLTHWNGITFFYQDFISSPEDLQLFTDAAPSIGYGGYYGGRWFAAEWPEALLAQSVDDVHSSALYELYPIVVAASLWGSEWASRSILVHSDNLTTVHIINKGRSSSLPIMALLRRLTWITVNKNFILRAAHIPGYKNATADALSRFSFQRFRSLAPGADLSPTPVPPFSEMTFQ